MKLHIPGVDERPRIAGDLSNMDEVNEYFINHGPHPGFLRGFHAVMDALVDPAVVYERPGLREEIREHVASGDPTVLILTHHSWFDPSNDAAAINQEKAVFDAIMGKTVIPARVDYFDMPVIGTIISIGGAKPMARKKDVANHYRRQGYSEAEIAAKLEDQNEKREQANGATQRGMVEVAMNGGVYASYLEGGRNRGDQQKLQPLRNGVKDLMEAMEPEQRARTKFICISHDYGGRLMRRFLTPTIHFNMVDAPMDSEVTNDVLHETLQHGLYRARENRRDDVPLSPLGKAGALAAIALGAVVVHKLDRRV